MRCFYFADLAFIALIVSGASATDVIASILLMYGIVKVISVNYLRLTSIEDCWIAHPPHFCF